MEYLINTVAPTMVGVFVGMTFYYLRWDWINSFELRILYITQVVLFLVVQKILGFIYRRIDKKNNEQIVE